MESKGVKEREISSQKERERKNSKIDSRYRVRYREEGESGREEKVREIVIEKARERERREVCILLCFHVSGSRTFLISGKLPHYY
jgi:hypothetical protein